MARRTILQPYEVFNLLQQRGSTPTLAIDLRSPSDYVASHITSAISLPREKLEQAGELNSELIAQCASSAVARSKLANRNTYSIVIYDTAEQTSIESSLIWKLRTFCIDNGAESCTVLQGGFESMKSKYSFVFCEGEGAGQMMSLYPAEIIEDFLYLGGQKNAESKEQLEHLQINAILNAAAEMRNHFAEAYEYHKVELHDMESQDISHAFDEAIQFVSRHREAGHRVLIHCAFGQSRSATLVLAYLISAQRLSLEQALEYLQLRKEDIKPNNGFLKQLGSFAKRFKAEENLMKSHRQDSSLLKTGWLNKKGGSKGKGRNFLKGGSRAIQRRWISLRAGHLFYYKTDERGAAPLGDLELKGARIEIVPQKVNRMMVYTELRDMEFEATSAAELQEWYGAISDAIALSS